VSPQQIQFRKEVTAATEARFSDNVMDCISVDIRVSRFGVLRKVIAHG